MAVSVDAWGTWSNGSGLLSSLTGTHNATAGCPVIVAVSYLTAFGAVSGVTASVTYDGVAMTALTPASGTGIVTKFFKLDNAPGGSKSVVATLSGTTALSVMSVSFAGAGSSLSVTPTTAGATGTSMSQSVTCSAGDLIFQVFGNAGTYVQSAWSGGTKHSYSFDLYLSTYALAGLTSNTATATTTFTGSVGGSEAWTGSAVVVSSAASGTTVTPTGASTSVTGGVPSITGTTKTVTPGGSAVTATGGAPVVTATSASAATPGGATVSATGGTPGVTGVTTTKTPGGAAVATTGGTPTLTGVSTTALTPAINKLAAGQSIILQFFGDSTMAGYGEDVAPPYYGWRERVCMLLARHYDANLIEYGVTSVGSGYGSPTTLRTSPRGGSAPTITSMNASVGGTTVTQWMSHTSTNIVNSPDCVFIALGINDYQSEFSPAAYASAYQTFVGDILALIPGTPIVACTSNIAPSAVGGDAGPIAYFSAMTNAYVGQGVPVSPPMVVSTSTPEVTVLDTRQAWTGYSTAPLLFDGLHPNTAGYILQAQFVLANLAPGVPVDTTVFPSGGAVSTTRGTPIVRAPQVFTPGGATITTAPGTPVVTAPQVVTPGDATVAITGGSPGVAPPVVITPSGATGTTTGGAPVVTAPQVDTPDGGTVTAGGGTPIVRITDPVELNPPPSQRINAVLKRSRINPVFSGRWVMGTQDLPYKQDPSDVVDYLNDWRVAGSSSLADGEVIVSSTWAAYDKNWEPAVGVSVNSLAPSFTDSTTTVWVSGGAVGVTCYISNHIVTDRGLEKDESFRVRFEEQ